MAADTARAPRRGVPAPRQGAARPARSCGWSAARAESKVKSTGDGYLFTFDRRRRGGAVRRWRSRTRCGAHRSAHHSVRSSFASAFTPAAPHRRRRLHGVDDRQGRSRAGARRARRRSSSRTRPTSWSRAAERPLRRDADRWTLKGLGPRHCSGLRRCSSGSERDTSPPARAAGTARSCRIRTTSRRPPTQKTFKGRALGDGGAARLD